MATTVIRRKFVVGPLFGALVLSALAGCGNGSEPSDGAPAAAAAVAPGSIASKLPSAILDQGYISNTLTVPNPPMEFQEEGSREYVGLDIDLTAALSEAIGFPIKNEPAINVSDLVP